MAMFNSYVKLPEGIPINPNYGPHSLGPTILDAEIPRFDAKTADNKTAEALFCGTKMIAIS